MFFSIFIPAQYLAHSWIIDLNNHLVNFHAHFCGNKFYFLLFYSILILYYQYQIQLFFCFTLILPYIFGFLILSTISWLLFIFSKKNIFVQGAAVVFFLYSSLSRVGITLGDMSIGGPGSRTSGFNRKWEGTLEHLCSSKKVSLGNVKHSVFIVEQSYITLPCCSFSHHVLEDHNCYQCEIHYHDELHCFVRSKYCPFLQ